MQRNWVDGSVGLLGAELQLRGRAGEEELAEAVDFLRSDHSRFWKTGDRAFESFPAVLVTDTGESDKTRGGKSALKLRSRINGVPERVPHGRRGALMIVGIPYSTTKCNHLGDNTTF